MDASPLRPYNEPSHKKLPPGIIYTFKSSLTSSLKFPTRTSLGAKAAVVFLMWEPLWKKTTQEHFIQAPRGSSMTRLFAILSLDGVHTSECDTLHLNESRSCLSFLLRRIFPFRQGWQSVKLLQSPLGPEHCCNCRLNAPKENTLTRMRSACLSGPTTGYACISPCYLGLG